MNDSGVRAVEGAGGTVAPLSPGGGGALETCSARFG